MAHGVLRKSSSPVVLIQERLSHCLLVIPCTDRAYLDCLNIQTQAWLCLGIHYTGCINTIANCNMHDNNTAQTITVILRCSYSGNQNQYVEMSCHFNVIYCTHALCAVNVQFSCSLLLLLSLIWTEASAEVSDVFQRMYVDLVRWL